MDCSKLVAVGFVISIILGAVIGSSAGSNFDLNALFSAAGAFGGLGAFVIAIYAYKFAKMETHRWAEREIYSLIDDAIVDAYQLSKLDDALREFYIDRKSYSQIKISAEISAIPHMLRAKVRSIKEVSSLTGDVMDIEHYIDSAISNLLIATEAFYYCTNNHDIAKQNSTFETGKRAYLRVASAHLELAKKIESLYPNQGT